MNDQLARIRYVTENFDLLQGLRGLPVGLLFLMFADGIAGWSGLFHPGRTALPDLTAIALCGGLYWWISVFYKRRFGRVERSQSRFGFNVLFFVAMFTAIYFDVNTTPPVSLLSLTFSVWFIWMYVVWNERIHYLVIGTVMVMLSLTPLLPTVGLEDTVWGGGGAAFLAAMGLGLIVGGLFDHRLLVQALSPAPEQNLNDLNLSTES